MTCISVIFSVTKKCKNRMVHVCVLTKFLWKMVCFAGNNDFRIFYFCGNVVCFVVCGVFLCFRSVLWNCSCVKSPFPSLNCHYGKIYKQYCLSKGKILCYIVGDVVWMKIVWQDNIVMESLMYKCFKLKS